MPILVTQQHVKTAAKVKKNMVTVTKAPLQALQIDLTVTRAKVGESTLILVVIPRMTNRLLGSAFRTPHTLADKTTKVAVE